MAIEIRQRVGSSLLPVPLGCDCSGGGSGADAGDLAAIRQELAEVAGDVASASADAASAIGLANDAAGVAESAAEAAAAAGEKAEEALAAVGSVKGKILQNALVMHLGGSNASDTIVDGRGLTADLPFATINAAFNWAWDNAVFTNLIFELHGDIEQDVQFTNDRAPVVVFRRAADLTENPVIHSDAFLTFSTCTQLLNIDFVFGLNGRIEAQGLVGGGLFMQNCNASIANVGISANLQGKIYACNCVFTGLEKAWSGIHMVRGSRCCCYTVKLEGQYSSGGIYLSGGSSCVTMYTSDSKVGITGDFAGPKYNVTGSSLLSTCGRPDLLPGSIAGVCDATSTVA